MATFFKILILVPIAVIILAFSFANTQMTSVSFDPFAGPGSSTAFVQAPLFVVLFLTLIVGVIVGGIATWFTQGANRRKARLSREEAEHWQEQVRRMRDQPPVAAAPLGRAAALSGRDAALSGRGLVRVDDYRL